MRRIDLYIDDIIDSINAIEERIIDLDENAFRQDAEKHESILHRLLRIGEAVNKIPEEYLCRTLQT